MSTWREEVFGQASDGPTGLWAHVNRSGRTRPIRATHPLRRAPPYICGISRYLFSCGTNIFLSSA